MPDLADRKVAYLGFTGPIDSESVTRIAATLNHCVAEKCDHVVLSFSSLGGLVSDGIFLYNHIRALPLPVTIYNTGTVASIAAAVFVAADERYASAHSNFMIHPTTLGGGDRMNSERLQSAIQAALADDQRTEDILRDRTALTDEALNARRYKDVYILPEQAVKFGLVSGIREINIPTGHPVIQI